MSGRLPTWNVDAAIIDALGSLGANGLRAREIAWETGIARSAVDQHLAQLAVAGLVQLSRPEGTVVSLLLKWELTDRGREAWADGQADVLQREIDSITEAA